jgi:5'-methylthioadenosine phosphorylase
MATADDLPRADVGVIGGSGLTRLLDDAVTVEVESRWGAPSAPVTLGTVGDRTVAFLPRHGVGHRIPPHRVPYRANIDVMRLLGVRALLGPFAAGSLRPELTPGTLVVVDQFVDRTSGRAETYHDDFDEGPRHLSLPDPYDPVLRRHLLDASRQVDVPVADGGTVVVVNGPRFSTRAESRWFRDQGWDLVNMTQHPEAVLAAEAGLPYAGLGIVTDHDVGLDDDPSVEPVTQEAAFAVFEQTVARVRSVILDVARNVPLDS